MADKRKLQGEIPYKQDSLCLIRCQVGEVYHKLEYKGRHNNRRTCQSRCIIYVAVMENPLMAFSDTLHPSVSLNRLKPISTTASV